MNTLQHMRDLVARNRGQATRFVMVDIDAIKDVLEWAEQEYQAIAEMQRQASKIRELSAEGAKVKGDCAEIARYAKTMESHGKKHGEERRRYMANNKALLARNEGLQESLGAIRDGQLMALHYLSEAERKISAAIRKAPATCRMLGLIK